MKKKFLVAIFCLMMLPTMFLMSSCGKKAKPTSISVESQIVKFLYQDSFSLGTDAKVKISYKKGKSAEFSGSDLTYDSANKKATASDFVVDYSAFDSSVLGKYEIKVYCTANSDISTSFEVEVVERPFSDGDVTVSGFSDIYDGQYHSIDLECILEGAEITYSTDGENYVSEKPKFKDVGTYTVYFKVDKQNYKPTVEGSKQVEIKQKEVSLKWSNTSFDYDEKEHIPTCVITTGVIAGDSCTVEIAGKQVNAGTYTANVTKISNSNYKLPENTSCDFVINHVRYNKVSITSESEFVYDGGKKQVTLSSTIKKGMTASGNLEATMAGNYSYTISLVNSNYLWSDGSSQPIVLDWVIHKIEVASPSVTQTHFVYDGLLKSVGVQSYNAKFMTKTGVESATDAGQYFVKFELPDTANYYWSDEDESLVAQSKIFNWQIDKATADSSSMQWTNIKNFNYDGTAKKVQLYNVPNGFTPIYADNEKTNAGSYTATVTFEYDTKNYNAISIDSLLWRINKINPPYSAPTNLTVTKGEESLTLANVSLADYAGFSWEDNTVTVSESGYYNAKFTPTDTTNYNIVLVQIYVNVYDTTKSNFTVYEYDETKQDKDIAIQNVSVCYDGATHSVLILTAGEQTTGNASSATILYKEAGKNTDWLSTAPAFIEPGNYVVHFKVSLDGYNDYFGKASVIITKADLTASASPVVSNPEAQNLTIDDKLGDVLFTSVNVYFGELIVYGNWNWKEPQTKLSLGTNSYKLKFIPQNSNLYNELEVDVEVVASAGLPLKSFTIGTKTYSVSKNENSKLVNCELAYGSQISVNFVIASGFKIYKQCGTDLQEVLASVQISNQNQLEDTVYTFLVGEDDSNIVQTLEICVKKSSNLDIFKIVTSVDGGLYEYNLIENSNPKINKKIVQILAVAKEDYLVDVYINDILYSGNIEDVELCAGENCIVVKVKTIDNVVLNYITAVFDYDISFVGESCLAVVSGVGDIDNYVVRSGASVSIQNQISLQNNDLSIYKLSSEGGLSSESFGNLTLTAGINVYKVVLVLENSPKIVKYISIYVMSDGGYYAESKFESGELNSDAKIKVCEQEASLVGLEKLGALQSFSLSDISLELTDESASYTIVNLVRDYYLITITKGTNYYKVIRIVNYFATDDESSYIINKIADDGTSAEVSETSTIEMSISDKFYFDFMNRACRILSDDTYFVVDGNYIYPKIIGDSFSFGYAIKLANGSVITKTLAIKVLAKKVFGFNSVKMQEDSEIYVDEKKFDLISTNNTFNGDINVDYGSKKASMIDSANNYAYYSQDGTLWVSGNKYVKIKINTNLSVYKSYENSLPVEPVESLENVLVAIQSDSGNNYFELYLDLQGEIVRLVVHLVENATTEQVSLVIKDGDDKVQSFVANLTAVSADKVSGNYSSSMNKIKFSSGHFEGDETLFYVHSNKDVSYIANKNSVVGKLDENGCFTYYKGTLSSLNGKSFIYNTEDIYVYEFNIEPNGELLEKIEALGDGENLSITVASETIELAKATISDSDVSYSLIDGSGVVETYSENGVQTLALRAIFNADTSSEFRVLLRFSFIAATTLD